jgi:hypothetical protein
MALNFPNSPSVNERYTVGSTTWIWDGTVWNAQNGAIDFTTYVETFNGQTGDVEGVSSFNGQTGAVSLNDYVSSVNGATGTITNVAFTDTAQTFTDIQQFSAGISASGGTFDGSIAVNGTSITSSQTTFNLLNSTVTTMNVAGAASSTINLGATDGSSTIDLNSNLVKDVEFRNYYETEGTPSYVGGKTATLTVDLSAANVFTYTTTGSIGTIAVTNIPSKAGTAVGFTLVITCGDSGYSVDFDFINNLSTTIKWAGGTPPSSTITVGNTDIVSYTTYDGGTTWYGFVGGLDFS